MLPPLRLGHDLQQRFGADCKLADEGAIVSEDEKDGRWDARGKRPHADGCCEPVLAMDDGDREKTRTGPAGRDTSIW